MTPGIWRVKVLSCIGAPGPVPVAIRGPYFPAGQWQGGYEGVCAPFGELGAGVIPWGAGGVLMAGKGGGEDNGVRLMMEMSDGAALATGELGSGMFARE